MARGWGRGVLIREGVCRREGVGRAESFEKGVGRALFRGFAIFGIPYNLWLDFLLMRKTLDLPQANHRSLLRLFFISPTLEGD